MSYRLLGAHVNALMSGLAEAITAWKPPLVVSLDHADSWHGIKAQSPNTLLVGRTYQPHEPDFNDKGLDPLLAARGQCDTILPWAERMGETYSFWQGVNEPVVQSAEAMQRLSDFEAERAQIMNSHGFRVVVGSFSVGNPSQLAWWKHFLPALEAVREFKGALALHEYAWPSLDHESPWYLLRHRKVYGGDPAHQWSGLPAHLKTVPLLITECGLDGGIEPGFPPRGWKARYTSDQFLQQLAWYDTELQKDPYVVGAALYCCCSIGDPEWASFNIWPELVQVLAREARPLYRPAQPKPAPPPSKKPTAPKKSKVLPQPKQEQPPPSVPSPAEEPILPLPDVPPPSPPAPPAEDMLDRVLERLDRIRALLRRGDEKS